MDSRPPLVLSVIVPVHNGAEVLSDCLTALRGSDLPPESWELIVVDDASTDSTPEVAGGFADRCIRVNGGSRGPAWARNRGSEVALGDVLAFVDADVCVHRDALSRFLKTLDERPDVAAVFGAYDTRPRDPGFVSQYRNLLHHYVHARQAGEADTFWAGCGAVRRSDFQIAGGFDDERFPRPQIEDIELGYRLRALGRRILLIPEIQGTHLKRWTLWSMVRNDLLNRGVPWMRLILEKKAVGPGTLNVRLEERVLTGLAAVGTLLVLAGALSGSPWPLVLGSVSLAGVMVGDAPLLRWFSRIRGRGFALRLVPLRLLYYVLNALAVGIAVLLRVRARLGRTPGESVAESAKVQVSSKSSLDTVPEHKSPWK